MKSVRAFLQVITISIFTLALFLTQAPVHAVGTTITVTGTADNATVANLSGNGTCDFREAIAAANSNAAVGECAAGSAVDTDVIHFNIGGGGAQTITLAAEADVTGPVFIDGSSQGGYAGVPLIRLTTGSNTHLLYFSSSGGSSIVKAMQLSIGGTGTGIALYLFYSNDNTIVGNYINTDGSASVGNNATGIELFGSSYNTIGGSNASDGNLFGGKYPIMGAGAIYDVIQGNAFGVQASGSTALTGLPGFSATSAAIQIGTAGAGVANYNTIRGNVITGYTQAIYLDARSVTTGSVSQNVIAGNKIGVGADGNTVLSNRSGITLAGAANNTIGGLSEADRNVISGNQDRNIEIIDATSSHPGGNVIEGNYIGTDATGSAVASPAATVGIYVEGGNANVIGGTEAGSGNVISGNGVGIFIISSSTGTIVRGNRIGTDADGNAAVPNGTALSIWSSANIGDGSTPGNNIISGNYPNVAIYIFTSNVTIFGNKIGVSASGEPLGNQQGIRLASGYSASVAMGENWIANTAQYAAVSIESGGTVTAGLHNCFTNNPRGVYNYTTTSAPFTYNWWDSSTGPYQATTNPTGTGDEVSDYVDYASFLTSAPSTCAPIVSLDVPSLSFGNQNIGTTSSAQTVTLTNAGAKIMTISSITAPAPYDLGAGTCPDSGGTLDAGDSCTILVEFAPTVLGSAPANLSIQSDAGSSPDLVALTGTGTQPLVSPDVSTLTFTTQLAGTTSASQTVTLTNTGSGVLTIGNIVTAAPYGLAGGTCLPAPQTVSAGSSCTILVQFSPSAAGPAPAGNLTITSDAASSPDLISLSGTGTLGTLLLKNGSFETDANLDNRPDKFTYTNFNILTDKRDCTVRKSGICSLKLAGNGLSKTAKQVILKSGAAGDDFTFSLWSKGSNVPGAAMYRLQVQFYNGTTLLSTQTMSFTTGTHGFQKVSGTFTAPGSYTKVVYKIIFKASHGTAWFDAGALRWAP